MNWRTDKPPRDDGTFIAMVGYPWPTMLMWNEHDDDYVYVEIAAGEMEGGKMDTWFENEHCREDEITEWQPMPDIPMRIQIAANDKRIRAREAVK